ncbi:hypothetical protein NE562_14920 [Butyricicoccus faecihominis]|uniref:hypothetical protein n=1 Tax=Butyricicoccus faecihominis TaxID=1712515 RepID=UPI0024798738|nr:hypothetical protein [Butyricicoccus faecihominis]MCQ5130956.1 hypothetical protein [Butyricicoccus faecihominis]
MVKLKLSFNFQFYCALRREGFFDTLTGPVENPQGLFYWWLGVTNFIKIRETHRKKQGIHRASRAREGELAEGQEKLVWTTPSARHLEGT